MLGAGIESTKPGRRTSNHWAGGDPFAELKGSHEYYDVFGAYHETAGTVDGLLVGAEDGSIYIGLRTGLLGVRSTPVPIELVRVNERRRVVDISASGECIEQAPLRRRKRAYSGGGG